MTFSGESSPPPQRGAEGAELRVPPEFWGAQGVPSGPSLPRQEQRPARESPGGTRRPLLQPEVGAARLRPLPISPQLPRPARPRSAAAAARPAARGPGDTGCAPLGPAWHPQLPPAPQAPLEAEPKPAPPGAPHLKRP